MKNAKIKEQQQLEFYSAIQTMGRDECETYCKVLIENARAPNYTLINQWDSWDYFDNPKKMYDEVYNGILKTINHLKKLNEVNI